MLEKNSYFKILLNIKIKLDQNDINVFNNKIILSLGDS